MAKIEKIGKSLPTNRDFPSKFKIFCYIFVAINLKTMYYENSNLIALLALRAECRCSATDRLPYGTDLLESAEAYLHAGRYHRLGRNGHLPGHGSKYPHPKESSRTSIGLKWWNKKEFKYSMTAGLVTARSFFITNKVKFKNNKR